MRTERACERVLKALALVFCAPLFAASPLSPEQERATFQLADTNLIVELAAAEPHVRAPVAISWDADGRMFVAEMTDYPSGPVSGRIRLLEDQDGDGRYERATIFATNLAFPNGVMPWKSGVLVTAAPDIWYLADTNSDRVADVRERILTGFAEGNQQLRVNGLFWGLDNWIYGANGRSDGEVKWADGSTAGSIRRHDFRFRLDTKQFEIIAGHSQFGMGQDDWGNRFPVFNNTPIRHVVMEERYLLRQPSLAGIDIVPSISPPDGMRVFAMTPPALLIPQPVGFFTSACGPSIYRGTALPGSYRGNYFLCEPVQNVVQRRVLVPDGSTFRADYAHTNAEFLASSDPWFHGVFTATGPDGALYIVDFYREWVEHPHWVAPELRDKVDWRKGEQHGRIWRVRSKDTSPEKSMRLSRASNAELVQALERTNGWVRDTAHRLLIERGASESVVPLERLVTAAKSPEAKVHALNLLQRLGQNPPVVLSALRDLNPRVREQGIICAEGLLAGSWSGPSATREELRQTLFGMWKDSDARVRLQLACSIGSLPTDESQKETLVRLSRHSDLDTWQSSAILSSAGARPWPILSRFKLLIQSGTEEQVALLERLVTLTAGAKETNDLNALAGWLRDERSINRLRLAASLAESLPIGKRAEALTMLGGTTVQNSAAAASTNRNVVLPVRLAAVRLMASPHSYTNAPALLSLLRRDEPESLQVAAAKALLEWNKVSLARAAFDQWNACSKMARRQLLVSSARSAGAALALFDAIETGHVPALEIDPPTRQALQKSPDATVKARAAKLFASELDSDREAVLQKYRGALRLAGDRARGAAVFERACVVCHQMQGVGAKVGPDLSGIGTHTRETLLVEILDPSRQVLPDFVSYTAQTKSGETITGFIANESATAVTLRRPNEPDATLARAEIKELRTERKSVMPDGLEAGINEQQMADLIEFLRRPDRTLFTQTK